MFEVPVSIKQKQLVWSTHISMNIEPNGNTPPKATITDGSMNLKKKIFCVKQVGLYVMFLRDRICFDYRDTLLSYYTSS